jgi:hypothetical protein
MGIPAVIAVKADSVRRASAEGLRTQILARWPDSGLLVWVESLEPGWSCHVEGPPHLVREVLRAYGPTPTRELTLLTPASIVYRWLQPSELH